MAGEAFANRNDLVGRGRLVLGQRDIALFLAELNDRFEAMENARPHPRRVEAGPLGLAANSYSGQEDATTGTR